MASYAVKHVEVWAGDILNKPGTLARVLESLTAGGVELEFMVVRRVTERSSRVFIAPIKSKAQKRAAGEVGLVPARGICAIRVEGPDRAGLGAAMTRAIAAAGINIRGASAAALGRKCVFYFAFKTRAEADAAAKTLRRLLSARKRNR